ncbi:MAG: alpha/beta fold hydrolase [bacterium]
MNGVNLSYQVEGEGPPLVLMHGYSTGSVVWEPVIGRLTRRFQIFRYDHRGHGDSGKPPGPYRIQDFADDLEAFLNYFGLDRVDLAGHSMGGRTALLFALQHGDRLNRLLLVGASGSAPEGDPRSRFETLKELAAGEGMAAVFDSDLYAFALPEAWKNEPARSAARERFQKNTPEGFCAAADAILATPDMRERLGEIAVPTWACAGERDAGPMAFSEVCEKNIPGCVRAIVPGCGHFPMLDATEDFIAQLEDFIDKNPGANE